MSLLLDARKKSQQAAGDAGSELSLEPLAEKNVPADSARRAGQNLFNAKIPSSRSRPAINRGLLYAAGGGGRIAHSGCGLCLVCHVNPTATDLRFRSDRGPGLVRLLFLAALALCPASALPQRADTTLWNTNNAVTAIARAGNTIYIGGAFTAVHRTT